VPAGLLRRDRAPVLLALLGAAAIAWLYLLVAARRMAAMDMGDMAAMGMAPAPPAWDVADFALTFAMWWVMMLGMMLPGAAPMILTFATIARRQRERGQGFVPTFVFAGGYLLVWGTFSIAATLLQWALGRAALLSPMLQTTGAVIGGLLFLLAGLYQFSPVKYACLRHCRSPFAFLLTQWRDGWDGALRMGWRHGLYCLGCCWVLMLLLFAVGAMNLVWVAAIAALVFAEKLLPGGVWIGRTAGLALAGFGAYLLARGVV